MYPDPEGMKGANWAPGQGVRAKCGRDPLWKKMPEWIIKTHMGINLPCASAFDFQSLVRGHVVQLLHPSLI